MSVEGERKMILKRARCMIMAIVLSVTLSVPVVSHASGNFSDTIGHWAEIYISKVFNKDIVAGYPNGQFYPDKAVTRAEFVSMVNKAFRIDGIDTGDVQGLQDVTYRYWYYNAVNTAIAAGYATGYDNNTFKPNNPISRQEAAVMLSKLIPAGKKKTSGSFPDSKQVADWASDAMTKMIGKAYMGPYDDGLLHPSDSLTRAQTSKILSGILDNEDIVTKRMVIEKDGTKLSDKIYAGGVLISSELEEGSATIDNCVIIGDLEVAGGGNGTVTLNNTRVENVIVDKKDGPVRLVTKGNTAIPNLEAYRSCYLQPSTNKNGYGFQNIKINKNAEVTLKGNFTNISINGSWANLTLASGSISNLIVSGTGKYSDITLSGKSKVTDVTVNAESYFHGQGSIANMLINADNVTYETKPDKMSVGLNYDRAVAEGDVEVDVTFEPARKRTDINLSTKIILYFNTSMKMADGSEITDSDISAFVSLRLNSKTGEEVKCTTTINSAKKEITLTPVDDLKAETTYYVVLKEDALVNAGGYTNDGKYSYFTTGDSSIDVDFTPSNGTSGIVLKPTVTIAFPDTVVKYSDGSAISDAYLPECIQFKTGSSEGSSVGFTASINSSHTLITLTPSANLTSGQKYYVAVVANKLKTEKGRTIPASSVTWTVGTPATPITAALLSSLTVSPTGGSNVLSGFSPSLTSYHTDVPFATTSVAVSAAADTTMVNPVIMINGTEGSAKAGIPLTAIENNLITVKIFADGKTSQEYTVNVDIAGNTDLNSIKVNGTGLMVGSDLGATVAAAATSAAVSITAEDSGAVITLGSTVGTGTLSANVPLEAGNQSVQFTVKSNNDVKTYTLRFTRLAP